MNKQSVLALVAVAALSACVAAPPLRRVSAAPPAPPISLAKVYFYPLQDQSDEQQDRDRYECHGWSVRQTGFDPSRRLESSSERGTVIPARSGGQTIGAAAAVGAVIGAIAGNSAQGAVVGAMAGAVVGSAAANAQDAEARQVERVRAVRANGRFDKQAGEFRRAMSACLEGRGYSVK